MEPGKRDVRNLQAVLDLCHMRGSGIRHRDGLVLDRFSGVYQPDKQFVLSDQLCLGSRRCRLISDDAEEPLEQWNLHFRQVYPCRDGFRIFVRIPGRASSGSDVLGLFRDAPPHREIYQSSFLFAWSGD